MVILPHRRKSFRAAPSGGGGGSGDSFFGSVTYLVNNEGTNGSKPSTATVGGTITYVGDAALTTAYYPTGQTSSLALDGAGTPKDSAYLASGTGSLFPGDFTIECWFSSSGSCNLSRLIDISANKTNMILDGVMSNIVFYMFAADGGGYIFNAVSLGSLTVDAWYHIAVCRSGSSMRLFLNGVQKGSTATNSATLGSDNTNSITMGSYFRGDANPFAGRIGPMRITKAARYTADFTPPTLPLPTSL